MEKIKFLKAEKESRIRRREKCEPNAVLILPASRGLIMGFDRDWSCVLGSEV